MHLITLYRIIFITVFMAILHNYVDCFNNFDKIWGEYKKNYIAKHLSQKEEELKFTVFKKNYKYIQKHNSKNSSYRLTINQFTHMVFIKI